MLLFTRLVGCLVTGWLSFGYCLVGWLFIGRWDIYLLAGSWFLFVGSLVGCLFIESLSFGY